MLVNKLWGVGGSVSLQHTTQIINLGFVHGYSGKIRRVNSPYMLVGGSTLRCLQEYKHLILSAFFSFKDRKKLSNC